MKKLEIRKSKPLTAAVEEISDLKSGRREIEYFEISGAIEEVFDFYEDLDFWLCWNSFEQRCDLNGFGEILDDWLHLLERLNFSDDAEIRIDPWTSGFELSLIAKRVGKNVEMSLVDGEIYRDGTVGMKINCSISTVNNMWREIFSLIQWRLSENGVKYPRLDILLTHIVDPI